MKGVASLYRWSVGQEEEVHSLAKWRAKARELRRRGALSCLLMRTDDGEFVGLVRWPSEFARSEALDGAEGEMLDVVGGREARLTVEASLSAEPPAPLGLAL